MSYYMHTQTGSVDTYDSWVDEEGFIDYSEDPDGVIHEDFVEVERDDDGEWVEVD